MISSIPGRASALICIDSYERSVPAGTLYMYPSGEQTGFFGLTELLLETDSRLREAPGNDGIPADGAFFMQRGELATFMLEIMFCRNQSWQGKLTLMENNSCQSFRSVLELVGLMDGALKDKARA